MKTATLLLALVLCLVSFGSPTFAQGRLSTTNLNTPQQSATAAPPTQNQVSAAATSDNPYLRIDTGTQTAGAASPAQPPVGPMGPGRDPISKSNAAIAVLAIIFLVASVVWFVASSDDHLHTGPNDPSHA